MSLPELYAVHLSVSYWGDVDNDSGGRATVPLQLQDQDERSENDEACSLQFTWSRRLAGSISLLQYRR